MFISTSHKALSIIAPTIEQNRKLEIFSSRCDAWWSFVIPGFSQPYPIVDDRKKQA
jgi:hypothetical protein